MALSSFCPCLSPRIPPSSSMPPRLNKRQIREQEELQALKTDIKKDATDSEGQSETSSPVAPPKPAVGGFAAKKKKKKSATATPATPSPAPESHTPEPAAEAASVQSPVQPSATSKKERKALKKQKAKEKQKDDMDDVDKALAELSVKYPDLKQQLATSARSSSSPATARSLAALLAVSLQHLDSEAELRKFFGSKVISAAKAGSSSSSARHSVLQRSNLTRPQPTWWPAQLREGLSVRPLTPEEVDASLRRHGWQPLHGEKLWTVEYSKKYRAVTFEFMRTVMSGGKFVEHSTAADYVDRALFTYERAFVGAFNFTSGANRLDFDHVENRPFFLALHRQVTDLQRRGCVRTAFEFAKLMYALEPWSDPHGALLHLDYLSIKAGMSQWLIDLWDLFESDVEKETKEGKSPYLRRILPNIMPGIAYSHALALFIREEDSGDKTHTRSTEALKDAVRNFPPVVPLLADKADIPLSAEIRSHPAFRIHPDASMLLSDSHAIFHLLAHLYAQRASSLWKPAARASWFAETVSAMYNTLPTVPPAPPKPFFLRFETPALSWSIYRHVLVNESTCRSLFPFVPRQILDSRQVACDPLPPSTRVSEYDSEFFRGVEDVLSVRPRSRRQEARLLEQLVPDAALRGQLRDFWDAHPMLAQRFPGGIVQFAQIAEQMPEVLEDLMVAVAGAGADAPQQREGEMPGGMPGGEVMVNFVEPEDDVDDLPPQPAVPPAGQQHRPEEDEEEEEEQEQEEVAKLRTVRLSPRRGTVAYDAPSTTWCFPSKKSAEYPGKMPVPTKPACASSTVAVHSHTPPFEPRPPAPVPAPAVAGSGCQLRKPEEAQLGLGGDAPALVRGVGGEVVVCGEHRPVAGVAHGHGHVHLALARAPPERLKLRVRDRPPLDVELADLHDAPRALVVPPELVLRDVVLERGQQVVRLLVVVPQHELARAERDDPPDDVRPDLVAIRQHLLERRPVLVALRHLRVRMARLGVVHARVDPALERREVVPGPDRARADEPREEDVRERGQVSDVEERLVPQVDRLRVQERRRDHPQRDQVPCRPAALELGEGGDGKWICAGVQRGGGRGGEEGVGQGWSFEDVEGDGRGLRLEGDHRPQTGLAEAVEDLRVVDLYDVNGVLRTLAARWTYRLRLTV
ncbi:hypothetical protein ACG7TL_003392 [Trametes sanguinea]